MEGVNEAGQSPRASSSTDFEFHVRYKPTREKRSTSVAGPASQSHTPAQQGGRAPSQAWGTTPSPNHADEVDDDLALAIRLSLEEEEQRQQSQNTGLGIEEDGFPPLETSGKGKGVLRY